MLAAVDSTLIDIDEDQRVDRIGQLTEELISSDTSKTRTQHVVKAHISSLVSALGGPDHTSEILPPPYKLGVNALAVLKDLKKWLKFDKTSKKWDVALAIGETSLATNDLLNILGDWEESYTTGSIFEDPSRRLYKDRIACLCLELLVPLTWPLKLIDNESTVNQVVNYHRLKASQLIYKKHLLSFRDGLVFRAVVRIMIPIISLPRHKRSVRDNSVLNLCVLFLRNILNIEPETTSFSIKSSNKKVSVPRLTLPSSISSDDISLNTVIKVFEDNKVLKFFLTVFAGLGKEFDDEILGFGSLECLYYLTNGVRIGSILSNYPLTNEIKNSINQNNKNISTNPETVSSTTSTNSANNKNITTMVGSELQDLLKKENKLKTRFIKESASRHSRFGSLLSLDTIETGRLTVSGQKALISTEKTIEQLNASKKWKSPNQRIVGQSEDFHAYNSVSSSETEKINYLSAGSQVALRGFAEKFIDGGFNQFINIVGKKFLGADVTPLHCIQYCLVCSWFLEFERVRKEIAKDEQKTKQQKERKDKEQNEDDELARLIDSTNNEFTTAESLEKEDGEGINNNKGTDDDVDEADEEDLSEYGLIGSILLDDNIRLLKMFLVREQVAADVSFCHAGIIAFKEIFLLLGEMSRSKIDRDVDVAIGTLKQILTDDEFLKALVAISKSAMNKNLMYVMSVVSLLDICFKTLEHMSKDDKLVIIRKQKLKNQENGKPHAQDGQLDEEHHQQNKARTKFKTRIREFNFSEFFHRFINEHTINTYMRLWKDYLKVDPSFLKRALRFYHKIYFNYKEHVLLLRLDFLALLHEILAPKNRSVVSGNLRLELEDFFKHYMKSLRQHMEQTPVLAVELLFPKLRSSMFYLNTGEPQPALDISYKSGAASAQGAENSVDEGDPQATNGYTAVKPIEFKPRLNLSFDQKIGVLVTALKSKNEFYATSLVKDLQRMCSEWGDDAIKPETNVVLTVSNEAHRKFLFRNAGYRLLLHIVGFQVPIIVGQPCELKTEPSKSLYNTTDSYNELETNRNIPLMKGHVANCLSVIKSFLSQSFGFQEGESLASYTKKRSHNYDSESEDDEDFFVQSDSDDNEYVAADTPSNAASYTKHPEYQLALAKYAPKAKRHLRSTTQQRDNAPSQVIDIEDLADEGSLQMGIPGQVVEDQRHRYVGEVYNGLSEGHILDLVNEWRRELKENTKLTEHEHRALEDLLAEYEPHVESSEGYVTTLDEQDKERRAKVNEERELLLQKEMERTVIRGAKKDKKKNVQKKKKKKLTKKRKRRISGDEEEGEEEQKKRKKKPKEQVNARYSSSMYIDSSDEESDAEADQAFFEKEKRLRALIARNGGIISKEQYSKFMEDFANGVTTEENNDVVPDDLMEETYEQKRTKLFVDDSDYEEDANEESDKAGEESDKEIDEDIDEVEASDKEEGARVFASSDDSDTQ